MTSESLQKEMCCIVIMLVAFAHKLLVLTNNTGIRLRYDTPHFTLRYLEGHPVAGAPRAIHGEDIFGNEIFNVNLPPLICHMQYHFILSQIIANAEIDANQYLGTFCVALNVRLDNFFILIVLDIFISLILSSFFLGGGGGGGGLTPSHTIIVKITHHNRYIITVA